LVVRERPRVLALWGLGRRPQSHRRWARAGQRSDNAPSLSGDVPCSLALASIEASRRWIPSEAEC
jgi:hypothetical protein